jgi:hypothetical protein
MGGKRAAAHDLVGVDRIGVSAARPLMTQSGRPYSDGDQLRLTFIIDAVTNLPRI